MRHKNTGNHIFITNYTLKSDLHLGLSRLITAIVEIQLNNRIEHRIRRHLNKYA